MRRLTAVKSERLGPWKADDWREFVRLSSSVKLPPDSRLSWLDPKIKAEAEQRHIEYIWTQLTSKTIYKWLKCNSHFQNAWNTFQRKQRGPSAKASGPLAEIEFITMMVFYAGRYFHLKGGSASKIATVRTREKAARAAELLLSERVNGLRLDDQAEDEQLFRLIPKLINELNAVKRKKRQDKQSPARDCSIGLAASLELSLGYTSAAIVADFAAMIGEGIDSSSATRYVRAAKQQLRTLRARAQ